MHAHTAGICQSGFLAKTPFHAFVVVIFDDVPGRGCIAVIQCSKNLNNIPHSLFTADPSAFMKIQQSGEETCGDSFL